MKTLFLVVSLLTITSVQISQADTLRKYNVNAVFSEPMLTPKTTTFNGSFTWNSSLNQMTNLHGTMNQAMKSMDPTVILSNQINPSASDGSGGVLATVFKQNTTDVFVGGGYATGGTNTFGNQNAYFSIDVNPSDPTNVLSGNLSNIVYADCSDGGLMGSAEPKKCMTGHAKGGTMKATPSSLTITLAISPDLGLNGSSLTISLAAAGADLGQNADWWLVAFTPWGQWYSYISPKGWVNIGTDLSRVIPAYQGPLQNISNMALFDITGLSSGSYVLYFGVDTNMNGVLDYDQLYYSGFTLNRP